MFERSEESKSGVNEQVGIASGETPTLDSESITSPLPGQERPSVGPVPAESGVLQAPTPAVPASPITYRSLLRNRNFVFLWLGQAISTFGSYFTRIAIPVYVFNLTHSYAQLGLAAFSSLLASLLFGLAAGALADRWDRRYAMIAADLGRAGMLIALVALTLLPELATTKLAGLYLLSFTLSVLRELFEAARVATFPAILSSTQLLTANSLDQATTNLGELLSYPLAGLVLLTWGPAVAFGVDGASYCLSALLLAAVQLPRLQRESAATEHLWSEVKAGLRAIGGLPLVRRIVVLSLLVPLVISLLNTLQLPYAVDVLGSTKEVGFPALEGALALGFTAGMLLIGRSAQRASRAQLLAYGIASLGLCFAVLGWLPSHTSALQLHAGTEMHKPWTGLLLLALPFMVLAGAANSLIRVSIRTVLQEETPPALLGRVASVVGVAASAGFAVGALLTGLGQGRVPLVFTLIGIILFAFGLFVSWWLPASGGAAPIVSADE